VALKVSSALLSSDEEGRQQSLVGKVQDGGSNKKVIEVYREPISG
jgi:hypothetical protein